MGETAEQKRMGPMSDHEEGWTVDVVDDRPIPHGKVYAPDLSVTISLYGEVIQRGTYPSYRIWTFLAHWRDGIPFTRIEPTEPTP